MSTLKELYAADSVDLNMTGFGALPTSSSFIAGWEFDSISNRVNLDLDHIVSGKIRVGTTPTINTYIQVWIVPSRSFASGTPTWPDVIDGTRSAETWLSAGIRDAGSVLAATILVDATTSDRDYTFHPFSVRELLGYMPWDYVVFVTHNTGVNLNSTDGNHQVSYTREQQQGV